MADFTPYVGVDDLKFGISSQDVEAVIGPPTLVRKTPRGESSEVRDHDKPRVTIGAGRLVEMSFLPAFGGLFLDGEDLMSGDGRMALSRIERTYGRLFTHVGFVVSLEAGIAVTGFHDGQIAQKAVTVFEEGRWARFADQLQTYTLY